MLGASLRAGAQEEPSCPIGPLPPAAPTVPGDRVTLFVSDLHMGVGKVNGNWHPTEDFRWHEEFDDFLQAASTAAGGTVDLILVGDIFELWQPLNPGSCDYDSLSSSIGKMALDMGCTEDEALRRFRRVKNQHRAFFRSVARFVSRGTNRAVLLPGNHDAALLFPQVAAAALQAFPQAARSRIHIASEGYWMSANGSIVAEHGQQIGADPNCFRGWPTNPFIEHEGESYLRKPWGEQLVQKLYNTYEAQFPTVDNLSERFKGIRYATQASGFAGALADVGRLIRFFFTQMSWDQTKQILGKDGVPIWKVDEELAKLDTSKKRWKFLVESYPADDPLRAPFANADFATLPEQPPFTKEEVEAICDRRWLLRDQNPTSGIELCEGTGKLGAISEKIGEFVNAKAKNERYQSYLTSLQAAIPATSRPATDFSLYVYGHTHKVEFDYMPFDSSANWAPVVFNDGAWQRTATPEAWCTVARNKGLSDAEAISQLQPEDLPGCYPYVIVTPIGPPFIRQMYWVQKSGSEPGSFAVTCTAAPKIRPECE
jgi:hypothetical protein